MFALHDSHEEVVVDLLDLGPQRIERGPVRYIHFILKRLNALEQGARFNFGFLEILGTPARILAGLLERTFGQFTASRTCAMRAVVGALSSVRGGAS
jgi:hypothetical protein